jgi:hypothetical protein
LIVAHSRSREQAEWFERFHGWQRDAGAEPVKKSAAAQMIPTRSGFFAHNLIFSG